LRDALDRGADPQGAGQLVAGAVDLLEAALQRGDERGDHRVERIAGCGGHDGPVAAYEQLGAELGLELGEALADGGLGDVQGVGRGADAAGLVDVEEHAEAVEVRQHKRG